MKDTNLFLNIIYNFSNLETVNEFHDQLGSKLKYKILGRREVDLEKLLAKSGKVKHLLYCEVKLELKDTVSDTKTRSKKYQFGY